MEGDDVAEEVVADDGVKDDDIEEDDDYDENAQDEVEDEKAEERRKEPGSISGCKLAGQEIPSSEKKRYDSRLKFCNSPCEDLCGRSRARSLSQVLC